MKTRSPFSIKTFPASRIGSLDVLRQAKKKNHIHALLELDVTEARKTLKELKKEGKQLSFTAWFVKMLSLSLEQHPEMHAFLKNKRQIILFEDINVSIMVEKESNGKKVPIVYVLRKTQEKSVEDLSLEIKKAKTSVHDPEKASAGDHQFNRWSALYFRLPGFIRRFFWYFLTHRPRLAQSTMGSVLVTSVGMYGTVHGWFIHSSMHPLAAGLGSIVKKVAVVREKMEFREFLHLTLLLDHDVTDGAQMARFVSQLQKNITQAIKLKPEHSEGA